MSRAVRSAPHAQPDDKDGDKRRPKRAKNVAQTLHSASTFRISIISMSGVAIDIHDASAADTVISVKERVFALNRQLHVCRQRLVYSDGPHGIDPLADDETLNGAGVPQDGTAKLDMLLAEFTGADMVEFGCKFLAAARDGRASELLELMNAGISVQFTCSEEYDVDWPVGVTALMLAAHGGHVECVKLLLNGSADVDAIDDSGFTALMRAVQKGRVECVRLLVGAGASTRSLVSTPLTTLR
jgi:hypothetical protein